MQIFVARYGSERDGSYYGVYACDLNEAMRAFSQLGMPGETGIASIECAVGRWLSNAVAGGTRRHRPTKSKRTTLTAKDSWLVSLPRDFRVTSPHGRLLETRMMRASAVVLAIGPDSRQGLADRGLRAVVKEGSVRIVEDEGEVRSPTDAHCMVGASSC